MSHQAYGMVSSYSHSILDSDKRFKCQSSDAKNALAVRGICPKSRRGPADNDPLKIISIVFDSLPAYPHSQLSGQEGSDQVLWFGSCGPWTAVCFAPPQTARVRLTLASHSSATRGRILGWKTVLKSPRADLFDERLRSGIHWGPETPF